MYKPIDCNFYDILEANAVLRKIVLIEYRDNDKLKSIENRIVDLFIKDKAEYMRLENDLEIRLDMIHSVDGNILKGFCGI
ncbi:MAG: hypothetical protein AB8G11_08505 [Saprospiraceae bacterium]